MCDTVLEARNLTRRYGNRVAVDDLSLEVRRGEVFGLLGPNGAGKTTSIGMICGLLRPDSGRVLIQGRPVRDGEAQTRLGVCPQEVIVWEKQTCREQLRFFGAMYDVPRATARKQADELLESLGLSDRADSLASTLSGGMQRRLSLALAMIHDPEILVLDEPEAGLDPQSRALVREYVRSLARHKTIIVTTHNMDEADRLADRVAIIDHGKLLVLDTPEALKRSVGDGDVLTIEFSNAGREEVCAALTRFELERSPGPGTVVLRGHRIIQNLPAISEAIRRCGGVIEQVNVRTNTLEDVFISLTGEGLRE